MSSNTSPSGRDALQLKPVRDMEQMTYRQARLHDLRTQRSCQVMVFIAVAIFAAGIYYFFIYSGGEYNPQGVGGAECKFSDDPSTRMIEGDLILRESGSDGTESWEMELPAGQYDIAYRFRPWSQATGDFTISIRKPSSRSFNRDFVEKQQGILWHAGIKTFTADEDTTYEMFVRYPQGMPWCLEIVPHIAEEPAS